MKQRLRVRVQYAVAAALVVLGAVPVLTNLVLALQVVRSFGIAEWATPGVITISPDAAFYVCLAALCAGCALAAATARQQRGLRIRAMRKKRANPPRPSSRTGHAA